MSLLSIYYSVNHILKNKNVNRPLSVLKYVQWQFIKAFNLFPVQVKVSGSLVEIKNKKLSLEGGTKIYTQGMYDYNNMNLVKHALANGFNTMLDISTNIGLYTLIASEAPGAKVYSFEPHPFTFGILNEQVTLNRRTNVFPVNKAAGNENKLVSFTDDAGSSVNKVIVGETAGKVISIEACRIADFCAEHNVKPQIVKIDVEGFELEVLQGFGGELKTVSVFLIEISRNHQEVHGLLISNGFKGPFAFDFRSKTFVKHTAAVSIEDPVYLSEKFIITAVPQLGFIVHDI